MLVCPNCNHQQERGKFCGVCGTALQERNPTETTHNMEEKSVGREEDKEIGTQYNEELSQSTVQAPQQRLTTHIQHGATHEVQRQQSTGTFQANLKNYWAYCQSLLKSPSHAFQSNEGNFVNSLVTIGLYILLFSMSLYFLGNSLLKSMGGLFGESLPFFTVVSRLSFIMIVLFIITFGSAFIMTKFAKNKESFKTIISQYGSLLVPFAALNIVATLGGLVASIEMTIYPLIISLSLAFAYIPVLFVYEKASNSNRNNQRVYLSLATGLLIALIYFIIVDAMLTSFFEKMEDILSFIL